MAIASSRTSASLLGFIREMNLTDKIAMVVGSDEVSRHKPDPEPVNVILSALDVPASETLVVGDMPVDILMGSAAGTHHLVAPPARRHGRGQHVRLARTTHQQLWLHALGASRF